MAQNTYGPIEILEVQPGEVARTSHEFVLHSRKNNNYYVQPFMLSMNIQHREAPSFDKFIVRVSAPLLSFLEEFVYEARLPGSDAEDFLRVLVNLEGKLDENCTDRQLTVTIHLNDAFIQKAQFSILVEDPFDMKNDSMQFVKSMSDLAKNRGFERKQTEDAHNSATFVTPNGLITYTIDAKGTELTATADGVIKNFMWREHGWVEEGISSKVYSHESLAEYLTTL